MWNKIKIIVGIIFIGGIMIAPTDEKRVVADAKKYGLYDLIADCHAPGGIIDQVKNNSLSWLGVWMDGINPFKNGKGHYDTNNLHAQNNQNYEPLPETVIYEEEGNTQIGNFVIPEFIRKFFIGGLCFYLGMWLWINLKTKQE